jgi:hypothetical protein
LEAGCQRFSPFVRRHRLRQARKVHQEVAKLETSNSLKFYFQVSKNIQKKLSTLKSPNCPKNLWSLKAARAMNSEYNLIALQLSKLKLLKDLAFLDKFTEICDHKL